MNNWDVVDFINAEARQDRKVPNGNTLVDVTSKLLKNLLANFYTRKRKEDPRLPIIIQV
ncbi:hypothetical protein [Paenibacillus allorhizoplanae]|uniref:hypothetical protein n=1 Tax=Paenibacillus allorhizoplanae TaxID=2905648 RepID=UPI001F2B8B65|nr:hypothetical protein [Paenibacillus allorhizoplanae]